MASTAERGQRMVRGVASVAALLVAVVVVGPAVVRLVRGPPPAPGLPLRCGQNVTGDTREGGFDVFSSEHYEQRLCWPAVANHDDGNEAIFVLELEEGSDAEVEVSSPGGRMSLAAIAGGGCSEAAPKRSCCEMAVPLEGRRGPAEVRIWAAASPRWLLVVEGRDGQDDAFELSVRCADGHR